ncbi:hypothetical protein [Salicibibacter kimchii]|uniref:hypothetical protein n=1 Tax=Salicibibacter kimchii TaxID=2099786 RepID=UPI001356B94C|nr:hypothetical protein [Salicibibacter kimchii]
MNEQQYLDKLENLRKKNWPDSLPSKPHYPFGEILITWRDTNNGLFTKVCKTYT